MNKKDREHYDRVMAVVREWMTDDQWVDHYFRIGFEIYTDDREEQISAAVQYEAAESGLMPDSYYNGF